MSEFFYELPPPEVAPEVSTLPARAATMPTKWLSALALVAGHAAYGGPEPPEEWKKWAWKVARKVAWAELSRRRRRHFRWDIWDTAFGPRR